MVALIMVAFWLPSSSHAWLQASGFIHADPPNHLDSHHEDSDDAHEHGASNHAVADGLCRTVTGSVSVPMPGSQIAYVLDLAVLWSLSESARSNPERLGPSPPGIAPPELSCQWQFSSRTALPARAPSFVS